MSVFLKVPLSLKRIRGMSSPELANAYSPDIVTASSPRKEESSSCLSPSMADHPLGPAIDHCLDYEVLTVVSNCCSPPKSKFLCVTHPSATRNTTSCTIMWPAFILSQD
ncbi:hypothetical protein CXB51_022441 [Gossypium anomalum]|uniref:Uncharacterized protein n=1 Tax=Gossypium anomalum TaxID=47600 RepID=A0A8J5YKC1_9ROSI|nr:hypothetical protein CXB51_022441 [Gossypium anomalum]